jgi:hypothetical protein
VVGLAEVGSTGTSGALRRQTRRGCGPARGPPVDPAGH